MKLSKGVVVIYKGRKFEKEIPDQVAKELGLLKEKPAKKKEELKEYKDLEQ